MKKDDLDFSQYKNIPYLKLIEIARNEKNIERRESLFEYSNIILQKETAKAIGKKSFDRVLL